MTSTGYDNHLMILTEFVNQIPHFVRCPNTTAVEHKDGATFDFVIHFIINLRISSLHIVSDFQIVAVLP